ncbi:MAG TPA: permease prefix domain 2-containing transporter [Candidatus Acidoferrum sp.]|jgi:hypothetical protein|nr:permease prefix domain 2-containing transporter [Candidatus Acidoferrum sp.]
MTSQAHFALPPRIATWLVNLFTPAQEAESILGDLVEEFSELASRSGVQHARRWYWRQTAKTIAHLAGTAFRASPWSTAAVVVAGFLLHGFVTGLPDKVLSAATDRYLAYWSTHFKTYMFFATDGMLIGHLVLSMLVGCVIALAAKGREMVATMTLALVLCALIGAAWVWVAMHGGMDVSWILWSCVDPLAIVVGGMIVRTRRSAATARPSGA